MPRSHLSPFPVDPQILACIRKMTKADVKQVARLHHADMGRSLWAQLGRSFLEKVYLELLSSADFHGYVYEDQDRIGGFIVGTTDGERMMRDTFRKNRLGLVLAGVIGILTRPQTTIPLLQTFSYFKRSGLESISEVKAESLFCSFKPEYRGKRISGLINKVLFDEILARGHQFVKITTDADNISAGRQLTSWGFEQIGEFKFYGKKMICWRLDLIACERVGSE